MPGQTISRDLLGDAVHSQKNGETVNRVAAASESLGRSFMDQKTPCIIH